MAIVNHETKEVVFKLVYCGTPLGGKTTNLAYIHSRISADQRGDLVSLATSSDRTLFFDFLPINTAVINEYRTRFQLYTVPGQVYYNATRQLVLRGADGLVFVADSQISRMEENAESLQTMRKNLRDNRTDPDRLPLVLQYNKRDLPDAAPVEYLDYVLNNTAAGGPRAQAFESIAHTGHNVFVTLNAISQLVLRRFHDTARAMASPANRPASASARPEREPAPPPRGITPTRSPSELSGDGIPS